MKSSSTVAPSGALRTRVLDLDLRRAGRSHDGSQKHVPMRIEVFYKNTIFRVRARVCPKMAWMDLVTHVLDALHHRLGAVVPGDRLRYNLLDGRNNDSVVPMSMMSDTFTDHLICIHFSEFNNALDRRRRAVLLADMLRELPWPEPNGESGAGGGMQPAVPPAGLPEAAVAPSEDAAVEERAGEEADRGEANGNEVADGQETVDLVESEPAEPDAEVPASRQGAWTQWHRSYADAAGRSGVSL